MTDFYGYRIAKVIKEVLIESLGLSLVLEQVSAGSPFAVQFKVVVQHDSDSRTETFRFAGYPDFVFRDGHQFCRDLDKEVKPDHEKVSALPLLIPAHPDPRRGSQITCSSTTQS